MMIFSRCVGEQFLIGDDIVITILRVDGGKVRLGIEAPVDYSVVRGGDVESPFKRTRKQIAAWEKENLRHPEE